MVVLKASQMEQIVVMSSLMDQGIIEAIKANYRKSTLHSLLAVAGKFDTATEFAKSVTVFDAIWWISSAWSNVQEETILNTLRTGDTDLRLYAYKQFKYPVPNVLSVSGELVLHRQRLTFRSRKTSQVSPI
jgi:hypothetical protein